MKHSSLFPLPSSRFPLPSYLLSLIFYLISLISLSATPFAALPYTFVGRVVNWEGKVQGTGAGIVIRVKNASGRLLAKTETFSSDATPYNFRLSVPVATAPADGCAVTGDRLVFEIVDATGASYPNVVPEAKCVVGRSGGLCRLDINLSTDSDGDGVPEQYIEAISGYMWESGHYVWEPDADWDGDGVSNKDEYKAGTNPFLAEDYFRIKALEALAEAGAEGFFPISFFAYPGRTYGVRATESLGGDAEWIYVPFTSEPDGTASANFFLNETSSGGSGRTIYVRKSGASGGFYRVTVE